MMLSKTQSRAGRALLGWSQRDLADKARVAKLTITNFESGRSAPYERTLADIQKALEKGGIVLIDASSAGGAGVRLKK